MCKGKRFKNYKCNIEGGGLCLNKKELLKNMFGILIMLVFLTFLYCISCCIAILVGVYNTPCWYSIRFGEMRGQDVIFQIFICLIGFVGFIWILTNDYKKFEE